MRSIRTWVDTPLTASSAGLNKTILFFSVVATIYLPNKGGRFHFAAVTMHKQPLRDTQNDHHKDFVIVAIPTK